MQLKALKREKKQMLGEYQSKLDYQHDTHDKKISKMQHDHAIKISNDEDKYRRLMKETEQQLKDFNDEWALLEYENRQSLIQAQNERV